MLNFTQNYNKGSDVCQHKSHKLDEGLQRDPVESCLAWPDKSSILLREVVDKIQNRQWQRTIVSFAEKKLRTSYFTTSLKNPQKNNNFFFIDNFIAVVIQFLHDIVNSTKPKHDIRVDA